MTINDSWDKALKELVKAGVTVKTKDGFKYLLSKGDLSYTVHTPHKGKSLGKGMLSNLRKFL